MINIGLMGLGTVGSGVYEIISRKRTIFEDKFGHSIKIKKILVKDVNKSRQIDFNKSLLTINPSDILDDPEIDIVVEVMSDKRLAYDYLKYALKKRKHVVTANKAVVASNMYEFLNLAEKNKRAFLYEASVGGGIPIIRPLIQEVNINDICEIEGILNGTTNYILTKMYDEEVSFHEALKTAQKKGYAEFDPTDDIKGYDTSRKLSIISTIAFHQVVSPDYIACRGIDKISIADISAFKELNLVPKLIGKAKIENNIIHASVEPVLVNKNSFYFNVRDAFNIISLKGANTGELLFYGLGAGKAPTANSVVLDILNIVKNTHKNEKITLKNSSRKSTYPIFDGSYYFRFSSNNERDLDYILDGISSSCSKYNIVSKSKDLIIIFDWISKKAISKIIRMTKSKVHMSCFHSRIEAGEGRLVQ
ncbi:homoserine dehydrogenase [Proteiniborus sp. DW1]|uniref:homoserine dehydrogenase n=1 Tax=Proteiniborus sp. DW1 TaxID=1889883 RepID=UPI00092E01EE|nr:homoserine dehydrogenase [Proteiniborus sp. DW1]SCG84168.1 homoserine dehydrogenase [Proteiniborus sp. DW1]